jgi:hypothetical protein
MRAKLGKPVIDRANKAVHVTLPNGVKIRIEEICFICRAVGDPGTPRP